MTYLVEIIVRYQKGILNPEARAMEKVTKNLGYDLSNLEKGKYFSYISKKSDKEQVTEEAKDLCKKFLSNPIIERYKILSIKEKTNSSIN